MLSDGELEAFLESDTLAVIGCSSTPGKPAHDVPAYLQRQGYRVIPVNPFADEILGEPTYETVGAVDATIDLVEVFRPSAEIPEVLTSVQARHADRGDAERVWLQLGIRHDEAVAEARANGLAVVQDRCLKVEHRRLQG
ncbi:hypothetical protein SAMN06264855_12337 [Halorubrum vacuolatum]|uniref:CoA-binding domain-containing protein n=2 Tax=Halorubrum vacuolatum TaxID=63740 RepID=A0A238XU81_HALVU|nr:CoA-binding protein [Halorubrum vacuolatum]SNR62565.1 hypothetical protein SAMN06264855_12337 [Halorubrum vacuolatum]